jgi:hypothetical protein
MEAMRAQFEREVDLESPWTSYNASLGRPLLNTEKFLSPKESPPQAQDSAESDEGQPESASPLSSSTTEETPTLPGLES